MQCKSLTLSVHTGNLELSIGVNLVSGAVKCFPGCVKQTLPPEQCALLIILSTSSIQTNSGNTRLLIAGIRFSDIVHFLCVGCDCMAAKITSCFLFFFFLRLFCTSLKPDVSKISKNTQHTHTLQKKQCQLSKRVRRRPTDPRTDGRTVGHVFGGRRAVRTHWADRICGAHPRLWPRRHSCSALPAALGASGTPSPRASKELRLLAWGPPAF